MKKLTLLFALSLLLFSCQKEDIDPAVNCAGDKTNSAAVTGRSPAVPFKATYETYPQVVGFNAGVITLSIPATGKGAHLGKSSWYADSWVDTNQFPFQQTGNMTFTAADGSRLYGTFSGIGIPGAGGSVSFEGSYTITHGDGRFAGATGSGTYSGWAELEGLAPGTVGVGQVAFVGVLYNP
ncbi:MAG: hypothetical protein J5I98_00945 [Phaeodactylibacter sp.]|nr:hypothetical protein [Phaeodactylibacter sp.]